MNNLERAAEVILPWIEREFGHPEDNADGAVQALADAGLLMPDLPEQDSKGRWATELFGGGVFAVREPGVVDLVRKDGVISNRAEVLRREALRMLAAAKLAEEQA